MKITYDTETDILRIRLSSKRIDESNELMPGVVVDIDAKGNAVGFEILDASKRIENPKAIELDVIAAAVKTPKKKTKRVAG